MKHLPLAQPGERLSVLCLGAHCDDIEIGAGATLLGWIQSGIRLDAHWVVLSANGARAAEAQGSAEAFLAGAARHTIELGRSRMVTFPPKGRRSRPGWRASSAASSPMSSSPTPVMMRTRIIA